MSVKIQFILKRREDFNPVKHSPQGLSTGLYNSAKFVADMLVKNKIEARLDVAVDNNDIDRLVSDYKPTHVIIEALWVVPSKFSELVKLHPDVQWIIRLHSEMPFMAGEGIAMDWLGEYIKFPTVDIAANAPRMLDEVRTYLATHRNIDDQEIKNRVFYLPNYYPQTYKKYQRESDGQFKGRRYWIDVACFGAIRPLKNHLLQAVAAIKYANYHGKQLRFHVNATRVEMQGSPALQNLRNMFEHLADHGHQLIGHEWTPRDEFLEICADMDVGLQVNFSETFNIVSADLISQGVPIVGTTEIPWSSRLFNAMPADSDSIFHAMNRAVKFPDLNVRLNQRNLTKYTNRTEKIWLKYFKGK